MTLIQELIKHFVLGIVSVLICNIAMAEINQTKDFIKAIEEVRKEYPEESIERKIPSSFIATIAATETGNFQFKGAPTAKNANNFFGMHATGDQQSLTTTGGAKLRYKDAVSAIDRGPEEMFKGMSVYAENPNYTNLLGNVYKNRIQPIFQTENFLMPKRKPIIEQMDSLK